MELNLIYYKNQFMSAKQKTPVGELINYIRQNIGQVPPRHEDKFNEILEYEQELMMDKLLPLVVFINQQIEESNEWYYYWRNQKLPSSIDRMATCRDRIDAYKEVIEFIEEYYKTETLI